MRHLHKYFSAVALAAFLIVSRAHAQNAGTVTAHAFAVGKGAGTTGYTSLLCTSAQLAVGQAAADPICQTITGDVTISAGGVTALGNIPSGVTAAGSLLWSGIAAPATPAVGKENIWVDSTDARFHDKNSAGTIGTTVVSDTGAANNFLTGIGTNGVITKGRPACANLSDSSVFCNGTNAVNLTGTIGTASVLGTGAASHGAMIDVAGVPTWKVVPDCQDSGGNHLNYAQASDAFSCGTSSSSTGGGGISGTTSVTGATTTYTSAQNTKLVTRSNSGAAMSDLLPGTSPGVLPNTTIITVKNNDTTGILSIKAGSGATLNAPLASTGYLYVCPGQSASFYSDGSNYWLTTSVSRCRLTGSTTIYVSASGSSSNDGLTASTALPDPGTAYSLAQSVLDVNYKTLTFSVANGTYPCVLQNGPLLGVNANQTNLSNVIFLGNAGTPANVVISTSSCNNAWLMENGAVATINGFTLNNTFGHDFQADEGSIALIENLSFTAQCAGCNIIISAGNAFVYLIGNLSMTAYTFNPGAVLLASNGGAIITTPSLTWTFSGAFNWNTAFAVTQYYALLQANGITFTGGTITGKRYVAGNGSTINTAGGGANYFPGNAAGTLGSFGTYQHHNDNDRNALGELEPAA